MKKHIERSGAMIMAVVSALFLGACGLKPIDAPEEEKTDRS